MNRDIHSQQLQTHCPEISPDVIRDYVFRMDPEYFERFTLQEISAHLHLAQKLSPATPCTVRIQKRKERMYDIVIVAYDYFAECATFCGVLGSFGLNIHDACISTFSEPLPPSFPERRRKPRTGESSWHRTTPIRTPGLARKKIVDVFRVQLMKGFRLGPKEQDLLHLELLSMAHLLDTGKLPEARRHINRRLMQALGQTKTDLPEPLHSGEILFVNNTAWDFTIMSIYSRGSAAFLYTFLNALTMRGIYMARATVEIMDDGLVRNRFYVRGRNRQPIHDTTELQHIRITAALVQEFSHHLSRSPDPAKAMEYFDMFLDDLLTQDQQAFELFDTTHLLPHLARLLGTSDFLWEEFLQRQQVNFLPILEKLQHENLIRPKSELANALKSSLKHTQGIGARKACLNQFKDEELFRIDVKHLLDNTPLVDFSQALTNLAEIVLEQALAEAKRVVNREQKPPALPNGKPCPIAICGLGKLGGGELGFASDIEILLVYDTGTHSTSKTPTEPTDYFERVAQEMLQWIDAKQEGIFDIDTRLRPHGEKGLLANSIEEIRNYYSPNGMAAPFERQAFIKLRAVAGDPTLGEQVESHRKAFVYSGEAWPLETALHLRERQTKELVPPDRLHAKYSPGGLIDIEYAAQYLQVLHGHQNISLQTPRTLHAISALQDEGYLSQEDADILHEDYLFLRQLIDGLRVVRGHAKDLILPPPDSEGMIFLARRLGFLSENWEDSAKALEEEIHSRMTRTHEIFKQLFSLEVRQRR